MTKIYLAIFEDKNGEIWNFQAFTNQKKAKSYQRYWNAVYANSSGIYDGNRVRIEELPINYLDYSEYAVKEELKNLPY